MFILTWVFIYKILTNYPKPNYHTQWQQQSKSNRISTHIWGHRKYGKRAEGKKVHLLIESSGTSFAAVWSTVWTALNWVTHRCTDTCCLVFPGSWQIHGVQPWEHGLMLMTLDLDSDVTVGREKVPATSTLPFLSPCPRDYLIICLHS